jgi:hypothetical protein
VALAKYVNTYDTVKLSDELLDALEDHVPYPVMSMTHNTQPSTKVSFKSRFLEELPFDEEDTARLIPIRD